MTLALEASAFTFELLRRAEESRTAAEAEQLLTDVQDRLDAPLCVGLQLRARPVRPRVLVAFGRAPQAWRRDYCEAGHLEADALVGHALLSFDLAAWADVVPDDERSTSPQLRAASALGLHDAVIAPQHRSAGVISAVLLGGADLRSCEPRQRLVLSAAAAAVQRVTDRLNLSVRAEGGVKLSRREAEALYWVLADLSDKEIASAMRLSPETVSHYVRSAQRKLGASGRFGAAQRAAELGLLPVWLPNSGAEAAL